MKNFQDYSSLLNILRERNLIIDDEALALDAIRTHGYHRLAGYRYPFRELLPSDEINQITRTYRFDHHYQGSSFKDVLAVYDFDMKLRRVILDGCLEFEVKLRAAVAHVVAAADPLGHTREDYLNSYACQTPTRLDPEKTKLQAWIETVKKTEKREKEDDYVTHFNKVDPGSHLPIWALVEFLELGSIPYLLDLMHATERNKVSRLFGIENGRSFSNMIRAISDLRNRAAHSNRLFNRTMKRSIAPAQKDGLSDNLHHLIEHCSSDQLTGKKLYPVSALLASFLQEHESKSNWNMSFKTQIRKLPTIKLQGHDSNLFTPATSMGFPTNWEEEALWGRSS